MSIIKAGTIVKCVRPHPYAKLTLNKEYVVLTDTSSVTNGEFIEIVTDNGSVGKFFFDRFEILTKINAKESEKIIGNYIYAGDTVTCINNDHCNLTYGKQYQVKYKSYDLISITNDVGRNVEYRKDRFELYNPKKITPEPVNNTEEKKYLVITKCNRIYGPYTLEKAKTLNISDTQYITEIILKQETKTVTTTELIPFKPN